jgi:hypothetical protein
VLLVSQVSMTIQEVREALSASDVELRTRFRPRSVRGFCEEGEGEGAFCVATKEI